jgi:hypothetical protein
VFDEILVDVLNSFGAATENALVTNNLGHFAKLKLAGEHTVHRILRKAQVLFATSVVLVQIRYNDLAARRDRPGSYEEGISAFGNRQKGCKPGTRTQMRGTDRGDANIDNVDTHFADLWDG